MKKFTSFLLSSILFFFIISFSVQAAEIKIGVIDTQKIIMQSEKIMNSRADFFKDIEEKKAKLMEKQKSAQMLDSELKSGNTSMSNEERNKKTDKLSREVKNLNRMKEEIELELKSKDAELGRTFLRQIRDVTNDFLLKNNYTIILEKGSVVASDNTVDITDEIIKLYDSKQ